MNELIYLSKIRQPRVSQNISIPRHANAEPEPEFIVKTFDRLDKVFRGLILFWFCYFHGNKILQVCKTNETTKQYFKEPEPEFVVKTFDRLDKVFRGNKIPGTEKGRGEYKWRQPSQVCTTNQTTKQYFKQTHKLTNQQNSPNKN